MKSVDQFVLIKSRAKIFYVNTYVMSLVIKHTLASDLLNRAQLLYCDGEGVRLGARLLGKYLPQRMTGADWIWDLCALCESNGYSLYLLGGEKKVVEKTTRKLRRRFPNLIIDGSHHGYFQKSGRENNELIETINATSPDILLVGFGSPLQEKWIHDNYEKFGPFVVWAVGALFDFISESVPRGPKWMLNNGLEWLFRFYLEPNRMWKRYLVGNLLFFSKVLHEMLLQRVEPRAKP